MLDNISINYSNLKNPIEIDPIKLNNQFINYQKRKKEEKQAHGFNTSPDKSYSSKNFYLMTDYITGSYQYEDSQTKEKKIGHTYKSIFSSLDEAFKNIPMQRQVFTGLNHKRRDVVVVDMDDSYPACFTDDEELERVVFLKKRCNELNIPYPSYIEFHSDSGHSQMGWYLTEYFTNYNSNTFKTNQYKYISKVLAKLLNADPCFRGGNIKNPYHFLNHPYFINKDLINTEDFISKIYAAADANNICLDKPIQGKPGRPKKKKSLIEDKKIASESRNCYAFEKTRSWTFVYMRKHDGYAPSLKLLTEKFKEFEYESLSISGKKDIEEDNKINISVVGILDFCQRHYSPEIANNIIASALSKEIQEKRRESSKITRQAQKALNALKALKLFSEGKSQGQIAKILGCTQPTVCNLLKLDMTTSLKELKAYILYHNNTKNKKIISFLDQIFEELNEWSISIDDLLKEEPSNDPVIVKRYDISYTLLTEDDIRDASKSNNLNLCYKKSRGDPLIL